MKERKERNRRPTTIFFSFVCPEGREGETRKLLRGLGTVSIAPGLSDVSRVVISKSGENNTIQGKQIEGVIFSRNIKKVVEILAKNKIAGYSHDTQVYYQGPDEIIRPKNG